MPIYSIILLYLFICNMSHVLEINYLILSYLILLRKLKANYPFTITCISCIRLIKKESACTKAKT